MLRRAPGQLDERERALMDDLERANADLHRAWLMHDQLREVFRCRDPEAADQLLSGWLAWARDSGLGPLRTVCQTIERHDRAIIAAVERGVNNARPEAMNSTVRLISHPFRP